MDALLGLMGSGGGDSLISGLLGSVLGGAGGAQSNPLAALLGGGGGGGGSQSQGDTISTIGKAASAIMSVAEIAALFV